MSANNVSANNLSPNSKRSENMDMAVSKPVARKYLFVATLLVALLVSVWFLRGCSARTPELTRADLWIASVEFGPFQRTIRASGRFEAVNQRVISAPAAGEVVRVLVQSGASVEADTLVLELQNAELSQRARAAQTSLSSAKVQKESLAVELANELLTLESGLNELEANYALAEAQLQAARELVLTGAISKLQLRENESKLQQLDFRLNAERKRLRRTGELQHLKMRAAAAVVSEQETVLREAQAQLDALSVRAGMTGTLDELTLRPGQLLQAGEKLASVSANRPLRARLSVPQAQAPLLKLGMNARIRFNGVELTARVSSVSPSVVSGEVEVLVDLADENEAALRVGQVVEASIELEPASEALSIPRPTQLKNTDRAIALFRINSDTATRTQVALGRVGAERVEVLRGLRKGDQVILTDLNPITEVKYRDVIQLR